MKLPAKNKIVSIARIKHICILCGLDDVLAAIKDEPPTEPFKCDGCSCWFDSWSGKSLYPACFFHDLRYWCGHKEDDVGRLKADAQLMLDVAAILEDTNMAEIMFKGVRLGGGPSFGREFSWGFGRK